MPLRPEDIQAPLVRNRERTIRALIRHGEAQIDDQLKHHTDWTGPLILLAHGLFRGLRTPHTPDEDREAITELVTLYEDAGWRVRLCDEPSKPGSTEMRIWHPSAIRGVR